MKCKKYNIIFKFKKIKNKNEQFIIYLKWFIIEIVGWVWIDRIFIVGFGKDKRNDGTKPYTNKKWNYE